jgi:hypothetical protein
MFTATLSCGRVLSYEARGFLPELGDVVPCLHHGYCSVAASRAGGGGVTDGYFRRAAPRAQDELVEWLRGRPEVSIHALRRERFTLRLIAAAEREGLVRVDLRAGRVALQRSQPQTWSA